jgi:ferredoxin-NADP reductase
MVSNFLSNLGFRRRSSVKGILEWQIATVKAIKQETPKVKSFTLALPNWTPHRAGQHYDIRLTAPDGYQAQRSYSIASEPERAGEIDLTVERLEDGEVSSYMHDVLVEGDLIEVRGPIGGYFVWEAAMGGPLFLIAGGSGVVPLMSMIRHRATQGSRVPTRLLYSSRTPEDVIYLNELEQLQSAGDGLQVVHTFTRIQPPGWTGYARRIDAQMLAEVAGPLGAMTQVFICGPTLLVEGAANGLVQTGIAAGQIRTERFGPSGATP